VTPGLGRTCSYAEMCTAGNGPIVELHYELTWTICCVNRRREIIVSTLSKHYMPT
jgi:hypothetical protein